ncbi:MAG: hypothetical protein ABIH23_05355 [bacterium]
MGYLDLLDKPETQRVSDLERFVRDLLNLASVLYGPDLQSRIESRPDHWRRWLKEYQGMKELVAEAYPSYDVDHYARRAVVEWLAQGFGFQTPEGYREWLHGFWDSIRPWPKRQKGSEPI